MPNHSDARNARNKTCLSLSLAILIIIMDMSGLAGLAAQEELEEVQEKRETLSGLNSPGFMQGLANQSTTFSLAESNSGGCAVLDNGELICWGLSDLRVGSGNSETATPIVRSGFPSGPLVESVSLGRDHYCTTLNNDKVYCWGTSHPSASSTTSITTPTVVSDQSGNDILASVVDSGGAHSCAILTNGSAVCWGNNYEGQLGIGYRCVNGIEGDCTGHDIEFPIHIPLPAGRAAIGLSVWSENTCFILDNSSVYCAGGFLNESPNLRYVSSSAQQQIIALSFEKAISSDGKIWTIQWNGVEPFLSSSYNSVSPVYDSSGSQVEWSVEYEKVVSAGLYNDRGCALENNGSVLCAYSTPGNNGITSNVWFDIPASVEVAATSIWDENVCIIYSNGSAQCWGVNNGGQLGAGYSCQYEDLDVNDCVSGNNVDNPKWVILPTGRHISIGEADDDGDGIWNLLDSCYSSTFTWTSNLTTDNDGDGCRDSDEDDDDDNDGYSDSDDSYPYDARFHQTLTMDDGWIVGGNYERVGINPDSQYSSPSNFFFTESGYYSGGNGYIDTSEDYLSYHQKSGENWIIDSNGDVRHLINSVPSNYTMNISSPVGAGAGGCFILLEGGLHCVGNDGAGVEPSNISFLGSIFIRQIITSPGGGAQNLCIVTEHGEAHCSNLEYSGTSNWQSLDIGSENSLLDILYNGSTEVKSIHLSTDPQHSWGWTRKCVVFIDGNASCSGSNNHGQLGNGYTSTSTSGFDYPVYFPSGISSDIETMALTETSTCALFGNGSIYCWGQNHVGQLGDGTVCDNYAGYLNNCNGNGAKPIIYDPVILPAGETAIALWTVDYQWDEGYCALLTNGGVWCWGPQGGNFEPSHALSDGNPYYLDFNGEVMRPGNRDADSDGVSNIFDNCPDGAQGWTSTPSLDIDGDGCDDATEDIDDDGDGYTDTMEISCGTDTLDDSDVPLDVDLDGICNLMDLDDDNDGYADTEDDFPLDPEGYLQLSLGDGFQSGQPNDKASLGISSENTCIITNDSNVRCWGDNNLGQFGNGALGGTWSNVSLPGNKIPISLSTGSNANHFCAIMDDGSLYCWGHNNQWQLGLGFKCQGYQNGCNGFGGISTPTQVPLPANLTAIAVSTEYDSTCAILDDHSVWCWGNNFGGTLGIGIDTDYDNSSTQYSATPAAVVMPIGVNATGISLGYDHACMLTMDGRVFCWGEALALGSGSDMSNFTAFPNDSNFYYSSSPVEVSSQSSYVSVSSGDQFSCAITTNGTVECWGRNGEKQLGSGLDDATGYPVSSGIEYQPVETDLPTNLSAVSISLGLDYACAIMDNMAVYCWGDEEGWSTENQIHCQGGVTTGGCWNGYRVVPIIMQLPTGSAIAIVTGGESTPNYYHSSYIEGLRTCVILNNARIYCSGNQQGFYISTDIIPLDITPQTNDRDLDGDGVFNNEDLCMEGDDDWISNSTNDYDGDGCQDSTEDLDDDNDYLSDLQEAIIGTNATNPDTDGDGYLDGLDVFPLDGSEWLDTDGDGIGNNADTDDDNDGWSDSAEYYCQTDSLDNTDVPGDNDLDGNCDYTDTDDDNDGTPDSSDDFPLDSGADTDTDGDGLPDTLISNYTGNLTEDFDDDNDGWNDTVEIDCGNDPLSNSSIPVDTDGDSVCDPLDVFPSDPSEWDDTDGDGVGDNSDVFPLDGSEWNDTDGDGLGDNIDPDADNDGWSDTDEDLCLTDWLDSSSIPGDIDSDGICDAQEEDLDNDGWSNANESLCNTDWQDINSVPLDTDGDWICDLMDADDDGDLVPDDQDVFPLNPLEWYDFDGDGIGDNADPDDDNDGCMDIVDDLPFDPTECLDTDGDGTGDSTDIDDDGDGIIDVNDPFPLDGAATVDTDGDGLPDFLNGTSSTGLVEDNDDDNDGYNDSDDAFPLDLTEWLDTDGDGEGNNADSNDDGDNCPDVIDAFPLNPAECYDTDGDGIGNNADSDDDNDGWLDGTEMACGTSDPLNASSVPDDFDSDGVCDLMDFDDDNDSIVDASDAFPFDPCASVDTDGDGLPDELFFNCNTTLVEDWDDDNDGYNDTVDLFPLDANEWSDFDMDGFGDNMDTDDDGDMVPDIFDLFPLNSSEWADNDGDGIGDNTDEDDDNDGTDDIDDDYPFAFGITTDTDGDGLPDTIYPGYNGTLSEDDDDDGDGVLDIYDQFPLDSTEWSDTDLDGVGNNADSDDDGDGWSDNDEWICGTDTLDANDVPDDSDGDGICDSEDDEDLTTLTGRAEYYLKSPVTVWMALIGILAGMIGGATSTSFRARKERNQLYDEMRDFTDSVRDNVDYTRPIPRQPISVKESKDAEIKNLVDQGYSQEVAEALLDSQR